MALSATFAASSTLVSLGGNVTLSAGDTYTLIGSDALAPMGDITIAANSATSWKPTRLTTEDAALDPELKRQLVEHQLLIGQQENPPLDDCRVVGSDCSPQLGEITATLELLQDPNTREQLGGDLTDALIERQLNDLMATLESVDWSQDPETIARAEAIGSVARTFVDACALHPLAGPCRGVALAITGSDVTGKISDGVQFGAAIANPVIGKTVSGSAKKRVFIPKSLLNGRRTSTELAPRKLFNGYMMKHSPQLVETSSDINMLRRV